MFHLPVALTLAQSCCHSLLSLIGTQGQENRDEIHSFLAGKMCILLNYCWRADIIQGGGEKRRRHMYQQMSRGWPLSTRGEGRIYVWWMRGGEGCRLSDVPFISLMRFWYAVWGVGQTGGGWKDWGAKTDWRWWYKKKVCVCVCGGGGVMKGRRRRCYHKCYLADCFWHLCSSLMRPVGTLCRWALMERGLYSPQCRVTSRYIALFPLVVAPVFFLSSSLSNLSVSLPSPASF